jgi:hypothetical protein
VSQEISGCDTSRSFGYYTQAWLALPITRDSKANGHLDVTFCYNFDRYSTADRFWMWLCKLWLKQWPAHILCCLQLLGVLSVVYQTTTIHTCPPTNDLPAKARSVTTSARVRKCELEHPERKVLKSSIKIEYFLQFALANLSTRK